MCFIHPDLLEKQMFAYLEVQKHEYYIYTASFTRSSIFYSVSVSNSQCGRCLQIHKYVDWSQVQRREILLQTWGILGLHKNPDKSPSKERCANADNIFPLAGGGGDSFMHSN